jgi:hypothetical protein
MRHLDAHTWPQIAAATPFVSFGEVRRLLEFVETAFPISSVLSHTAGRSEVRQAFVGGSQAWYAMANRDYEAFISRIPPPLVRLLTACRLGRSAALPSGLLSQSGSDSLLQNERLGTWEPSLSLGLRQSAAGPIREFN